MLVRGRSEITGIQEVKLEWVTDRPIPTVSQTYLFSTQWNCAADNVPVLNDHRANYWDCLAFTEQFFGKFTPEDELSIGWVKEYRGLLQTLDLAIKQFDKNEPLIIHNEEARAHLGSYLDIVNSPDASVQSLVDAVSSFHHQSETALWDFDEWHAKLLHYARSDRERELGRLLSLARQVFFRSSKITKEGKRALMIDSYRWGKTDYVNIEPRKFQQDFSPKLFWERLPTGQLRGFSGCVTGQDIPMDFGSISPLWKTLPLAEDAQSSFDAAATLIDEALASKKWTIPNGAVVKLRVGPFDYFQLWEFQDGVYFLGRSEKNEYLPFWLNMKHSFLKFPILDPYVVSILEKETAERLRAALMLLFSAIVRDFFVIETREKVFETRQQRQIGQRIQKEGPVTIYLPRVRYVSSADTRRCMNELSYQERSPHFVKGHLRKASTASEHQLLLAARYGFDVPTGYTFVRPHERGHKLRDTIYRSHSALQSLYQVILPKTDTPGRTVDWFQFERDVQTIMKKLGFQTEHVGASRRGDHGVDVYATKGRDFDAVAWVIQCKCYSPNRKVQPATVRELLGTLEEYSRGVRGMI